MKHLSKKRLYIAIIPVLFALIVTTIPGRASAQGLFDGGMVMAPEIECSCQGEGIDITVQSYVDQSDYVYLYMPGVTQLFMNYNIESPGSFFLTTLVPVGVCMVGVDPYCDDDSPDGTFILTGTSYNFSKNIFASAVKDLPGVKQFTQTFSGLVPKTHIKLI